MATFRLKTFQEILLLMFSHVRALEIVSESGVPFDLNPGSVGRTFLEAAAMSDADQYVQMSKLKRLFSIFSAKGDDLDARMVDYGSEIWPELKRRPANTSISQITVGDGSQLVSSTLLADVMEDALLFYVPLGAGATFPSAGSVVLDRGTPSEEEVVYARTNDTFSVIWPTTGLAHAHAAGTAFTRVAVKSTLDGAIIFGATTAVLAAGTGVSWSASGTVIFERGTIREEKITFTRAGDTLTLGAGTAFAHNDESFVHQSTAGVDRTINAGTVCYAPATDVSKQISFRTQIVGRLLDGDFQSQLIDVVSEEVGAETRVGANAITRWSTSPFANATVTNPISATRGSDREKDEPYLRRALEFIQSLSRGTPLSVITGMSGLRDPVSGRVVAFAQIIEPVVVGESLLYITDGTSTFSIEQLPFLGRDVVIRDAEINDRRGRLSQYAPFAYLTTGAVTPRLFKSINRGVATSVGVNFLEDTSQTMAVNFYEGAYLKTDDDQFYLITANTAIRFTLDGGGVVPSFGSYAVIDFGATPAVSGTSTSTAANTLTDATLAETVNAHTGKYLRDAALAIWPILSNTATAFTLDAGGATPASGPYSVTVGYPEPLTPGTDFTFNPSRGDLELSLANALVAHDCLVAASDGASPSAGAYMYSTGLGAYAQRVVNGDPAVYDLFPGIRATGTQIRVVAPTVVAQTFVIKVVAAQGFTDANLAAAVSTAVQAYVNSLGIGANVILAEIIAAVMEVVGVDDCAVLNHASNIIVPDGQLMRIDDTNVELV